MSDPERPESVPASAVWVAKDSEWVLGGISTAGKKHGTYRYWRRDGTLCCEELFRDGMLHGPFKRFHENGEISQTGGHVDNKIHGTRTWYGTDSETTEVMRAPGMSETLWRSEMDYANGNVTGVRHFDREGKRILPNGDDYPDRPEGVPAEADYSLQEDQWMLGSARGDDQEREGRWQIWSTEGTPISDEMYSDGKVTGHSIEYFENGKLKSEGEYVENYRHGYFKYYNEKTGELAAEGRYVDDDSSGPWKHYDAATGKLESEGAHRAGERHGVWKQYSSDGAVSEVTYREGVLHGPCTERKSVAAYDIAGAVALRGAYDDGTRSGVWQVLGANDEVLLTRDYGVIPEQDDLVGSPALENVRRSADEWSAIADGLMAEQRICEALLVRARAAARSGTIDGFVAALGKLALPATRDGGIAIAREVIDHEDRQSMPREGVSVRTLFASFVDGAAPDLLCRSFASFFEGIDRGLAGLDFINAAILVAPERKEHLFMRAWVLIRLGLPQQVMRDVEQLAKVDEENARYLRDYTRVLFPRFDFWPASEKPVCHDDDLPRAPSQSIEVIRAVVAKYAHRLMAIRNALGNYVKLDIPWMLPDLSHLADPSVALVQESFEATDEDGDEVEVSIDEMMEVDGVILPELLSNARGDWAALTWLLWSCGVKELVMPKTVAAPADFGQAVGMVEQRYSYFDRGPTFSLFGGMSFSMGDSASKAPSFTWEGMDVASMSENEGMVENQYADIATMFRWLTDAEAKSPWQDNL